MCTHINECVTTKTQHGRRWRTTGHCAKSTCTGTISATRVLKQSVTICAPTFLGILSWYCRTHPHTHTHNTHRFTRTCTRAHTHTTTHTHARTHIHSHTHKRAHTHVGCVRSVRSVRSVRCALCLVFERHVLRHVDLGVP